MNEKAKQMADDFLYNETQFHLGMLPTEQSEDEGSGQSFCGECCGRCKAVVEC